MTERLHIVPHEHAISPQDREQLNGHRGHVLWFTGLSGSGKSTLASAVEKELHRLGIRTFILDGDNVRAGLNSDLGFDAASREENIRRIAHVSALMKDAGIVVLSAFVSPYRKDRAFVKNAVGGRFSEVFERASAAFGVDEEFAQEEVEMTAPVHSPVDVGELCGGRGRSL